MDYPQPNEYGSYDREGSEILAYSHERTHAKISILKIAPETWVSAIDVKLSNCGYGEPLNNNFTYKTRSAALMAAAQRIETYASKTDAPDAPGVIKWSRSHKQMTLF